MRKIFLLTIVGIFLFSIYLITKTNLECKTFDPKYCLQDNECICSTNPCFLGNKEYYNRCFVPQQKEIVEACPDACGFGPYEIEFKTICENNRCKLASFNRTTGKRMG